MLVVNILDQGKRKTEQGPVFLLTWSDAGRVFLSSRKNDLIERRAGWTRKSLLANPVFYRGRALLDGGVIEKQRFVQTIKTSLSLGVPFCYHK
jgi:hypothetical protein